MTSKLIPSSKHKILGFPISRFGTLGAPSGGAYGFPRGGGLVLGRIPGEDPSLGGKLAVTTLVGGVGDVACSEGLNRSVEVEVTSSNWSGVVEKLPDEVGDGVVAPPDVGGSDDPEEGGNRPVDELEGSNGFEVGSEGFLVPEEGVCGPEGVPVGSDGVPVSCGVLFGVLVLGVPDDDSDGVKFSEVNVGKLDGVDPVPKSIVDSVVV